MKTVAKTLLFDRSGKILILYRSETHPRYAHHPDLPGGEVEVGETPSEAVRREIEEETRLSLDVNQISVIYSKAIDDELTHIVCITKLDDDTPDIELSWEHEMYEWLTLEAFAARKLPEESDDYYLTVLNYVNTRPSLVS